MVVNQKYNNDIFSIFFFFWGGGRGGGRGGGDWLLPFRGSILTKPDLATYHRYTNIFLLTIIKVM